MPDYSKAKIYKIVNQFNNEIYVGSTIESLSARMAKHRCHAKAKPHVRVYKHFNSLGIETFSIELIEYYPCATIEELQAKEGEWIRKIGTLNHQIAGRSLKQWLEDNKDINSEKAKLYRQNNVDEIRARRKEHRVNNIEHER
jgi:group I intron endonuclease